jgi:cytochrome P450
MQQQLRFVNKGLNQINMKAHVGKIVLEAEEWFDKWPESGQIDLMKELSELIILTISKLLDEQKQILDKYQGELSLNSLSEMNLLHAVMKETLRLYPPLVLLMRKVLEPISYNGYMISKSDIVVVSPSIAH